MKENGPLVASLLIESDAPGCKSLAREVRVVDGLDDVEIINTVDKLPIRAKEGVHFGFGFNVPDGMPRFDVGWAAVRPELDQIPAACKNWFSVQRWVDISNDKFGVTWSPVDAPLVEVGGITANLIGSQTDPERLDSAPRALADHLLVGDEQPLAHQLSRRPGRPHRLPLLPSARTSASRQTTRPGSASPAPSR